jgi:hypothetical protein
MDILAALRQEETGDVCRCESEDFESNKKAVGKV